MFLFVESGLFTEFTVEYCVDTCFKWFPNVFDRLKPDLRDFSTRSIDLNMTRRFVYEAFAFALVPLRGEIQCYKFVDDSCLQDINNFDSDLKFIKAKSVWRLIGFASDLRMNWYMILLKIDPNHTEEAVQHLRKLQKNPMPDINLNCSYYVFGTWDACVWFCAGNHDNAMNFVQKYIRNIPWVTETYILPTTTIKEY